ncbi:hypothetical protein [Leptospira stimsonii]|uniref:Lipoprotein n=1 Tax=Leptospira stimsonii TaxID=2202203 RepID=A0A396YLE3_9LEPT|nr:hypothetical protein [Leptospira stimsonii]RHX83931.1 hypothetical protein DLM75_23610 [Leptospira stimsonii]
MKRRSFLLLVNFALFGCLQFPNVPTRPVQIERVTPNFDQNDICYEFGSQTMNGRTLEENLKKFGGKAHVDFLNEIKTEIQKYLVENSRVNHCQIELKTIVKILISLNINSYADCSIKQNADNLNGCEIWFFFSGLTLGVIPFWGTSTSEIRFEVIDTKNQVFSYPYRPSIFAITHILLLPLSWINLLRGMPAAPFKQSVELFLFDSGLKEKEK